MVVNPRGSDCRTGDSTSVGVTAAQSRAPRTEGPRAPLQDSNVSITNGASRKTREVNNKAAAERVPAAPPRNRNSDPVSGTAMPVSLEVGRKVVAFVGDEATAAAIRAGLAPLGSELDLRRRHPTQRGPIL